MAKLPDVLLLDTRANQPVATSVSPGTLYSVTDEDNLIEQSDGTVWTQYGPTPNVVASGLVFIEETTPTGTSTSFSSLGSYRHLRIEYSARGDQAATSTLVGITFNGDTGANYDRQVMNGAATTVTAGEALAATSAQAIVVSAASAASGNVGVGTIEILDYRGTTFHKGGTVTLGYKTSNSTGGFNVRTSTFAWRSTSAITSITLTLASGNFVTGSKFTLYGLA